MGKIESVMKSEIVRIAQRQLRATCAPLAKDVRQLKRTVSHLRKVVGSLARVAAAYAEQVRTQKSALQADEEEVKGARISGKLIQKLRKRLGLSQEQLALLIGVSGTAVTFWETGRTRPGAEKKAALVALRKLGKREVREILAQKAPAKSKKS